MFLATATIAVLSSSRMVAQAAAPKAGYARRKAEPSDWLGYNRRITVQNHSLDDTINTGGQPSGECAMIQVWLA